MTRAAKTRRVYFIEEPVFHDDMPRLDICTTPSGVRVVVPVLSRGMEPVAAIVAQRCLVDELLSAQGIEHFHSWYYTPMALKFSRHLRPAVCIYDCMDQLSHFKGAPSDLSVLEQELLRRADVVYTGGLSLYEDKCTAHYNIHSFPSSVDVPHFIAARTPGVEPSDQSAIPGPRIGYVGVIDERIDLALLGGLADERPDWHLVMVGPVVKIDPASLPKRPNIHYLGAKAYADLPSYLAHWDIAMLPFARNDATRYISPTKTPEYLAAGRPVISTAIRDVVRPYGEKGLVAIANTPGEFIARAEALLTLSAAAVAERLQAADRHLLDLSWDKTWSGMDKLIERAAEQQSGVRLAYEKRAPSPISASAVVMGTRPLGGSARAQM